MRRSHIPFRRRLSVRQAQVAVSIAVAIGIVFALLQILLDARDERRNLSAHGYAVLNYASQPAARAAYRLDVVGATELAQSLLSDSAVTRVSIVDDVNVRLADAWRDRHDFNSRIAGWLLGSEPVAFERALRVGERSAVVGRLEIELDPVSAAPGFEQRTLNAVISGVFKSVLLAILLLYIYHHMTTKRIVRLAEDVSLGRGGERVIDGDELEHLEERLRQWMAAFQKAAQEADDANKAKTVFLASMSHEMRTPLNAIIGYAEMLELGFGVTDARQRNQYLNNIAQAGRQLNKLLGDILDFSKIEAGSIDYDLQDIPLADVVRDNLEQITEMVESTGLELKLEIEADDCITVDPGRLRQVLYNFISNAVKYNKPGGSVTIGCRREDEDRVRLFVRDTGIGIPEEHAGAIFGDFVRGIHHKTDIPGAGLGLAICRVLITGMGGQIECESRVGEGSTFWVEFPIVGVAAAGESVHPN